MIKPPDTTGLYPHGMPASMTPTTDARAPETVEWSQMPADARAAACKAALAGGFELETCEKRYNPTTRLAFALKPHQYDPQREVVSIEPVTTFAQTIAEIRARFGPIATTIENLINPPQPTGWRRFWSK